MAIPARLRATVAFYRRYAPIVGFWNTARISNPRALHAPATFTLRIKGLTNPLTINASVIDLMVLHEVLIGRAYELPIESPRLIIDLGAHIGVAACRFASRYPAATVIAVEPAPENFAILRVNATRYENVVPVHAAISDRSGRVSVVDPHGGSWAYRTGGASGDIEAVTIEQLFKRYGIEHVDLLKVDIEGAEVELFSGPCLWLDQVDAGVVELHDRFRVGCREMVERATQAFARERRSENVIAFARKGPADETEPAGPTPD